MDLKIPKGTKDIFGEDAEKKILIECIVTEIMRSYNFKPSFTPVFEFTELFVRGIGKSTDIVKKEMYTFKDRGGRQLTLRPEGTAPIARLYIMNNLEKLSKPVKLYYFLPMYRYERPQAGRSREFWQIGAEIIGSDSYLTDVEAIALMLDIFKKIGISNLKLHLNSMGCPQCRKKFIEDLRDVSFNFIRACSYYCSKRVEKGAWSLFIDDIEKNSRLSIDVSAIKI